MKIQSPQVNVIDFETKGIEGRPDYPPEPVGVSIKVGSHKAKYYAWGHPTKNNCTKAVAQEALRAVWGGVPMLYHNAKFDVDVAQVHMGMPEVSWEKVHDTQFLAFLNDPHAFSLALKGLAEKQLGIKPDERDAVKEWVLKNVPEAAKKPSTWGAYIWMAPGDIVGRYANRDVDMTDKLFKHLYPLIFAEGMLPAYNRERQLMPIFLENERTGIRVDIKALRRDIPLYQKELAKVEEWIYRRIGVINIDSDAELAMALNESGMVTDWAVTKTGKRSTSKKTMTVEKFTDKKFFLVLGYRNRLTTCLRIFMEPWLTMGEKSNGRILPTWNQVRQSKGSDGSKGTRTGRPSCDNPNLLNIAKSFEDRGDDYTHPTFLKGLLPLPLIRRYTLPDVGCVWLHRDYNQQELRILAHFEDGAIMDAYKADPLMDIHTFVQKEILRLTHLDADRVTVKTLNFGKIYGQGMGSLAEKLRMPVDQVKMIRDAQNKALPGLPELEKEIKAMGKAGNPVITWGGRVYHVEPPQYVEKFRKTMTFEYKLLNYIIQGSAADATKEAIIRYYNHPQRKGRLLVTVYDEINVCVPRKFQKTEMKVLQSCMEGLEFDVPLLTDGKAGESWGNLEKVRW